MGGVAALGVPGVGVGALGSIMSKARCRECNAHLSSSASA